MLTVIHTCCLSVQRSLRCTPGIHHEYVHLVSSTYGSSGLLLVCTSITVTVDDLERRLQEMPCTFKFIGSRRRDKQVDHCFNGWQFCIHCEKLLKFLMTLNKSLSYTFSTMESNYVLLSSFISCLPTALEQNKNLKKQQSCNMLTITVFLKVKFSPKLHIQQNRKCDACIEARVSVTISFKHLTSILTQRFVLLLSSSVVV